MNEQAIVQKVIEDIVDYLEVRSCDPWDDHLWPAAKEVVEIIAEEIKSDWDHKTPEWINANARLIAAAPELLEALQLALSAHGRMLLSDPPQDAWKAYGVEEKARAAIAKAEGVPTEKEADRHG
jgi:hypothetical protein